MAEDERDSGIQYFQLMRFLTFLLNPVAGPGTKTGATERSLWEQFYPGSIPGVPIDGSVA